MREFTPFLSYDFERFSLASLESLQGCIPKTGTPKALNWPLIRVYYASFFAAHAIMRATGCGVFRLEAEQAKKLTEIAETFSCTATAKSGTYEFAISRKNHTTDILLNRIHENGGAHELLWRQFYKFLSSISSSVADADEPDANLTIAEITQIQSLMSADAHVRGTWLTSIRNQVNYQHSFGVWFPYNISRKVQRVFGPSRREARAPIRLDYLPAQDTIQAFTECCRAVAAINFDITSAISARHNVQRFKQLWNRLNNNGGR
jgi:hypothetical protein